MVSIALGAPRVASRRRHGEWRLASAQFLALVAAVSTVNGVFAGAGWWWLAVFIAAIVFACQAVLRWLGVSPYAVPFIGFGFLLVVITAIFGGGTGLLWVVPTPATAVQFGDLVTQAASSINQQAVPAAAVPPLLFLLAAGTGLAAVVMDSLAVTARMPAVCGLVMFGVIVVPATLLVDGVSPLWLVACACAYVYLLRAGMLARRPDMARPMASMTVAASSIIIALVVSVTAPGFSSGGTLGIGSGMSVGYGVSPLINLGKDLRRPVAMTVLKYNSTSNDGQYLKLLSLDQFSGATWSHKRGPMRGLDEGRTIGKAPGLTDAIKTTKIETIIRTGNVQSPWLPAPYPVTQVDGLNGDWAWDAADLSITSRHSNASDRHYRITSLDPAPTANQLQNAVGPVPQSVEKDTELPKEHMPSIITRTAERVTAGAEDEYQKAVDLQDYFRNTDFTYSILAPVDEGYDGDGMDVIATFLKKKQGYCVHFASAMAIMARTLGIPSRVSIGYLPGSRTGEYVDDRSVYEVSSDDLHAWPELYFNGVGWVRFEPTVGLGVVPTYTEPISSAIVPLPTAQPLPSATKSAALPQKEQTGTTATALQTTDAGGALTVLGIVLAAIALAFVPAGVRRWRRDRRLRRLRAGKAAASVAWEEFSDTVRDYGWWVSATETPRALAQRLAGDIGRLSANREALDRLQAGVERERFGPPQAARPDAGDRWADDVSAVLAALEADAGILARAKAFMLPASLFPFSERSREAVGHTA